MRSGGGLAKQLLESFQGGIHNIVVGMGEKMNAELVQLEQSLCIIISIAEDRKDTTAKGKDTRDQGDEGSWVEWKEETSSSGEKPGGEEARLPARGDQHRQAGGCASSYHRAG